MGKAANNGSIDAKQNETPREAQGKMRIRAQKVRDGLHPSEVVVSVATVGGHEKLIVDNETFKNDSLDIGFPIEDAGDKYLVELPHETESGSWRVWVPEDELS